MIPLDFLPMLVKVVVLWGGSGFLTYKFMDAVKPYLRSHGWTDLALTTLSFCMSGSISIVAWWLGMNLGIFAWPEATWQSWLTHAAAVVGLATGAAQWVFTWADKQGQ